MKLSKFALSTLSVATLGFLALGLASTTAFAATVTNAASFTVNATVGSSCSATAGNMAFGNLAAAPAGFNNDTTSTITVTCLTASVPFTVGLGAGASTIDNARTMVYNTTNLLKYSLSNDVAGGTNWGLTTGTKSSTGALTTTYTVYGRVKASDIGALPAGTYSDTINVQLTF